MPFRTDTNFAGRRLVPHEDQTHGFAIELHKPTVPVLKQVSANVRNRRRRSKNAINSNRRGAGEGAVRWVDAEEDIGWARRQIAAKKNAP